MEYHLHHVYYCSRSLGVCRPCPLGFPYGVCQPEDRLRKLWGVAFDAPSRLRCLRNTIFNCQCASRRSLTLLRILGTGGENRTPLVGFGDELASKATGTNRYLVVWLKRKGLSRFSRPSPYFVLLFPCLLGSAHSADSTDCLWGNKPRFHDCRWHNAGDCGDGFCYHDFGVGEIAEHCLKPLCFNPVAPAVRWSTHISLLL